MNYFRSISIAILFSVICSFVNAQDALTNAKLEKILNSARNKTAISPSINYSQFLNTSSIGGVGIIETPTARFRNDGTMTLGMSAAVPFNRSYFVMQALPWLELTIKYNQVDLYPEDAWERWAKWFRFTGGSYTGRDKSFDARIKILEETDKRPALAIGLTDLAGTNKFAGEYIVASKNFGDIDLTFGLGFGAMAGRGHIDNPLGVISDKFKRERTVSKDLGGTFNVEDWFNSDKAAFFGSLQYATPIENLNFMIEYDPKDLDTLYFKSFGGDPLDNRNSPINFGFNYSLTDSINMSVALVRGDTAYLNFSASRDLNKSTGVSNIPLDKKEIGPRLYYEFSDLKESGHVQLINRMMYMLAYEGITPHTITVDGNELIAEISQIRYRKTIEAVDMASRILAENSTSEIELITVSYIDKGIESFRSTIPRNKLVNILKEGPLKETDIQLQNLNESLYSDETYHYKNNFLFPNLFWDINPNVKGIIGGRDHFYFWKLEALLNVEYSITKHLSFTGQATASIVDNFDDWVYEPMGETAGTLYRVRSDLRRFYRQGRNSIQRLQFDYMNKVGNNLYARGSFGIYEDMFAGVGGEILYYSQDDSWAIGVDGYWVKQRDYNQMFSFRDYETFTGHLSLYKDIPFYNTRLKISIGRFLAEDEGINIDIHRRFRNGTVVGASASFTNVTKKQFGEGSFSKWVYATIPFDLFTTFKTRNTTTMVWTPLTRDGGQPLHQNFRLYPLISNANDEFEEGRTKNLSISKIFSGFSTKPREKI